MVLVSPAKHLTRLCALSSNVMLLVIFPICPGSVDTDMSRPPSRDNDRSHSSYLLRSTRHSREERAHPRACDWPARAEKRGRYRHARAESGGRRYTGGTGRPVHELGRDGDPVVGGRPDVNANACTSRHRSGIRSVTESVAVRAGRSHAVIVVNACRYQYPSFSRVRTKIYVQRNCPVTPRLACWD
jgi:hypothetical protein